MEKASLFDGVFPDKRLDERCARIFEGLVDGQCAVLRQALPAPAQDRAGAGGSARQPLLQPRRGRLPGVAVPQAGGPHRKAKEPLPPGQPGLRGLGAGQAGGAGKGSTARGRQESGALPAGCMTLSSSTKAFKWSETCWGEFISQLKRCV